MAVDVSKIKDQGLATAVYNLGLAVERKVARKNWQPPPRPPRDPSERYRGHSENQVAQAKRLADRILGERDD